MRLATVCFDDTEYVPAFIEDETWNGWIKPVLFRTGIQELFGDKQVIFEPNGCRILDEIEPEDYSRSKFAPLMTIESGPVEYVGLPAYDFRGLGYTFSQGPDY